GAQRCAFAHLIDGRDHFSGIPVGREAVPDNLSQRAAARETRIEDAGVLSARQRDRALGGTLEPDLDGPGAQEEMRPREADQLFEALQTSIARKVGAATGRAD